MPDLQSLRYVGDGAFRPGLPMRDIDYAELAHFDPEQVSAAIAIGLYEATFSPDEMAAEAAAAPTKAQLRQQADDRGLKLPARATNAQLAEAIAAFDAEAAGTPDEQPAIESEAAAAPEGEQ